MIKDNFQHQMFFIFAAVFINLLVFAAIPRLSHHNIRQAVIPSYESIFLANYEPQPPQPVKKEEQPKMEEKKPAKEMPKAKIMPKKISLNRPKMKIHVPVAKFEINPMLSTGMSVSPPPPEPVLTLTKTEPVPYVSHTEPAPLPVMPSEFAMGDVDQTPRIKHKIEPSYPYRAKRRNIEGSVTVKFLVSETGNVKNPSIIKAEPQGVFEKSALQAIRQWKFEPGIWQGKPVPTWVVLPIQFSLNG